MKTIRKNHNSRTFMLIITLLVLTVISAYSQRCEGNEVRVFLKNVSNPNSKTLEFDLFITNSGSTSLSLAALQGALIYDSRMIPDGASTDFSVINESISELADLNRPITQIEKNTHQLRWTQNPVSLSSGRTVSLPSNKSIKFARFRLTSSMTLRTEWSTKLDFQLAPQRGMTKVLATVYCNNNNSSIALIPKIGSDNTSSLTGFAASGTPNPFQHSFSIALTSQNQSKVNIRIYDIMGRLIESKELEFDQVHNVELGNNLPAGVYHVLVSQDNENQTLRMIKQ